ncbi:MAG: nuclear transport factor 2 family protein [Gammaproteobacteria bacterium]
MPKPLRGVQRRSPPPEGVTPIERLIAHDDIQQLANRYAVAVGAQAFDVIAELFVEDVAVAPGAQGREALREFYERTLERGSVTWLLIGDHVIDLTAADRAEGIVYCYCETGTERKWMRQLIAYEDRYERHAGQWYFRSRRHELVYGVEMDGSPIAQPPANWPMSNIGRGTVPFGWPTWKPAGG